MNTGKYSTSYKDGKLIGTILYPFFMSPVVSAFFTETYRSASDPIATFTIPHLTISFGPVSLAIISSFILLLPLLFFSVSRTVAEASRKIQLHWVLCIGVIAFSLYIKFNDGLVNSDEMLQASFRLMHLGKKILCIAAATSIVISFCQLIQLPRENPHKVCSGLLIFTPLVLILWTLIDLSTMIPDPPYCVE